MITDLKDFDKMLQICRKRGVTEISVSGITAKLGDLPGKAQEQSDDVPTDELTPEQLLYYAVNGGP